MKKILQAFFIIVLLLIILFIINKSFHIEEKILKHFYPIQYEEFIYQYSEELNIDPLLTLAIIKTESNFKENITSKSGAIGLMQLMESTAKEESEKLNIPYSKEMLYYPKENIYLGLNYFDTLLSYFNNNYVLAFVAYNAGLGNTQKWINEGIIKNNGEGTENIPFRETNMYVRKIIRNYKIYQDLYDES